MGGEAQEVGIAGEAGLWRHMRVRLACLLNAHARARHRWHVLLPSSANKPCVQPSSVAGTKPRVAQRP